MMRILILSFLFFVIFLPRIAASVKEEQAKPTSKIAGHDREVIKVMEILLLMDLIENIDILKEMDVLMEEESHENNE